MGEYAKYNGDEVKIGTCEDMYYLRFDQRFRVQRLSGNVDPVHDAEALRFRFPWPDEDLIEPGSGKFHDNGYHRSICIHGFAAPNVDHDSVQFVAHAGYNVCLPCPESAAYTGSQGCGPLTLNTLPDIRVHRNGFSGSVHLVAQRLRPGIGLVPVLRCGGCGTMWREEECSRIEEIAVLLRAEGDKPNPAWNSKFWHTIADRVLAGITELDSTDMLAR